MINEAFSFPLILSYYINIFSKNIFYALESAIMICNETTQYDVIDSEDWKNDMLHGEIVREVENFKKKPKSNLEETETVNLRD